MTSSAKKNNERVHALCESLGWFGRGKRSFRLFEQVSVPNLTTWNSNLFMMVEMHMKRNINGLAFVIY